MTWRVYGRGNCRKPTRGDMNKLEAAYADYLEGRRIGGEVMWWKYNGIRFRLTNDDKAFYTPDFIVMLCDGTIEIHETKGHWEHDALLRIKFAAELYPFRFVAIHRLPKKEGGGWVEREFGGSE